MSRGLVTVQMDHIFIGSPKKPVPRIANGWSCFHSPHLDKFTSSMIIIGPDTQNVTADTKSKNVTADTKSKIFSSLNLGSKPFINVFFFFSGNLETMY